MEGTALHVRTSSPTHPATAHDNDTIITLNRVIGEKTSRTLCQKHTHKKTKTEVAQLEIKNVSKWTCEKMHLQAMLESAKCDKRHIRADIGRLYDITAQNKQLSLRCYT